MTTQDVADVLEAVRRLREAGFEFWPTGGLFRLGDRVRKIRGSSWQGHVVGFYETGLTKIGYCVESEREPGSVQIYPEAALEPVPPDPREAPCGECHIRIGETCDICGAMHPS